MFKPLASPVRTFDTPIKQILAREPSTPASKMLIAVRTAGSTKLLEVQPKANSLLGIVTKELATFTRSHFDDRLLTDLAFHDLPDSAFFCVSDSGNIYKYDVQGSYPAMYVSIITVSQCR